MLNRNNNNILIAIKNAVIALDIKILLKNYNHNIDILYNIDRKKFNEILIKNYSLIVIDEEIRNVFKGFLINHSFNEIPTLNLVTKKNDPHENDASILLPFDEKRLLDKIERLLNLN